MNKKILIGVILSCFLLLVTPCINAVEYNEVKEEVNNRIDTSYLTLKSKILENGIGLINSIILIIIIISIIYLCVYFETGFFVGLLYILESIIKDLIPSILLIIVETIDYFINYFGLGGFILIVLIIIIDLFGPDNLRTLMHMIIDLLIIIYDLLTSNLFLYLQI
jgi:hypothetical protein